MSNAYGSIVGVKPEPEPDGAHMIKVADFGGDPFEVIIHPWELAKFVATLQSGLVNRAAETNMPQLKVDSIGLAHNGKVTGLIVSTNQMGRLVLEFDPEVLRLLRGEIDRALSFIEGPEGKH